MEVDSTRERGLRVEERGGRSVAGPVWSKTTVAHSRVTHRTTPPAAASAAGPAWGSGGRLRIRLVARLCFRAIGNTGLQMSRCMVVSASVSTSAQSDPEHHEYDDYYGHDGGNHSEQRYRHYDPLLKTRAHAGRRAPRHRDDSPISRAGKETQRFFDELRSKVRVKSALQMKSHRIAPAAASAAVPASTAAPSDRPWRLGALVLTCRRRSPLHR